MSKGNNINVRLKDLKYYMCNEINQIINYNQESKSTVTDDEKSSKILKLKPTKHKMACRINNNCRKRCYPMSTSSSARGRYPNRAQERCYDE